MGSFCSLVLLGLLVPFDRALLCRRRGGISYVQKNPFLSPLFGITQEQNMVRALAQCMLGVRVHSGGNDKGCCVTKVLCHNEFPFRCLLVWEASVDCGAGRN